MHFIKIIGLIASIILPVWNLPLIVRIIKRKSSKDISIFWALGVWGCLTLMLPAALVSQDLVFKIFGISNFLIFTAVTFFVLKYR